MGVTLSSAAPDTFAGFRSKGLKNDKYNVTDIRSGLPQTILDGNGAISAALYDTVPSLKWIGRKLTLTSLVPPSVPKSYNPAIHTGLWTTAGTRVHVGDSAEVHRAHRGALVCNVVFPT